MRYSIEGEPLPVVICELENGETMITESGAMSWMSPNMQMETTGGGIGKMFGPWLEGAVGRNEYGVIRALKQYFDPDNIMNPGGTLGLDVPQEEKRFLKAL